MKIISPLLLVVLLLLSSITVYSQEERKLPHFDKVRVTNQIKVFMVQGGVEQARVNARGIDLSEVITDVNGKTLEITLKRGVYKDISVEVWVTYRELRDVFVTASGSVVIESELAGDKVILSSFTGSQLDANVNLRTADIRLDKGANINLKGKVGTFEARVSSGATLSAFDLVADSVYLNINTRGMAKVTANAFIDANVRTGGTLTYMGNPKVRQIKSGLGTTIVEQ